uniref:Putative secreted protein n=1 Tax=Anopheles darlingi TaxID=43151 RepID=A0A2M4DM80_ANODA
MMLLTLWIARNASLLLMYVTYADAEGPCTPAYAVLGLMTTLWIFPYFPKYSCFFRISGSANLGGSPTTNTRFFCTTRTFARCFRFSEIFALRCWSR